MIHAIGWLIKTALFAAVILVLGNWIHWGGRTVSDQVKNEMKQVERSHLGSDVAGQVERLETWTKRAKGSLSTRVSQEMSSSSSPQAPQHLKKTPTKATQITSKAGSVSPSATVGDGDKIPPSERQKLRALIQELNTSTSAHLNSNE